MGTPMVRMSFFGMWDPIKGRIDTTQEKVENEG